MFLYELQYVAYENSINTFVSSQINFMNEFFMGFMHLRDREWLVGCGHNVTEVVQSNPWTFSFCSFTVPLLSGEFMQAWLFKLDNLAFLANNWLLFFTFSLLGSPFHDFNNWLLFFSTAGLMDLVASFFILRKSSLFLLSHQFNRF